MDPETKVPLDPAALREVAEVYIRGRGYIPV